MDKLVPSFLHYLFLVHTVPLVPTGQGGHIFSAHQSMTHWFIFHEGKILLQREGDSLHVPCQTEAPLPISRSLHLPSWAGIACKAAASKTGNLTKASDHEWLGLRASFDVLSSEAYRMAGKAYELVHWDDTTQFCSKCGSPLESHTDISKICPDCRKEYWPVLSVAVIVAVTRNQGKELLMVQSRNFKGDYYGLVAGFVETGETPEECLCREVMEETGYRVKNIRYFASQPWPYPSNLMLGFTAEWDGGEFCLQTSELRKGGWFTRENLPQIPGKVSLARRLIDHWLNALEN